MGANWNVNDLELAKFMDLAGEMGIRVHLLHGDNWAPAVANFAALPWTGNTLWDIRQLLDTGVPYRWNGSAWSIWISGSSVAWGAITGTLSNQTDLQTALNAKMGSGAYVLVSQNSALANQVNLGALTTGILKQTVSAGISTFTIITDNSTNWNTAYTHSQIATGNPHGTTKADIGLGNVDNTSDVNKPVSTAQATADTAALNAAKAYADGLVVGLLDDRGNYNASVNTFPASWGSWTAGAILKGDLWTISVAGTLGGTAVTAWDIVRAIVDTPGQTAWNWAVSETNIGYTAENQANKSTSITTDQASNTKYPSVKSVYDWGVATFAALAGSISQAFAALTIDIGHASDTTLSRSAAGVLAVEWKDVPTVESVSTFSVWLKTFLDGKIWLRNVANTFTGLFTNTITASRTWTLPDTSWTLVTGGGTASWTNTGDETAARIGALINGSTDQPTPADTDIFALGISSTLRKLTYANLKAGIKSYYDSVTSTLTNKTLTSPIITTAINAQTGTTYTLVLTDQSKIVTLTNAAAIAVTIPTNASVAFPIGTQIDFSQDGAWKVTFSGAGVTINSLSSLKSIGGQYVGATLIKTATDTWNLYGNLIA